MAIILSCLKCRGKYTCDKMNTMIQGPVVTSCCPHCGKDNIKNISAFAEAQFTGRRSKFPKASTMMALSRGLCKLVNGEKLFSDVLRERRSRKRGTT